MELAVAIIALAVTLWQLKLQREETRRNSEINSLIHVVTLLREKIDYHERIIEGMKGKKADWSGHAYRVNSELRPMLAQVNARLLTLVGHGVRHRCDPAAGSAQARSGGLTPISPGDSP